MNEKTKNKCTVVVCTCDLYEDIWNPFFTLLGKYWKDCPYPIVLNTESKSFQWPGFEIHSFHLYQKPNQVPWSERLIEHLKRIDSDYVLILMEDFFLDQKVKQGLIDQCIEWMDKDHAIACFDMYMTSHRKIPSDQYPGFSRRPRFSQYKFNTEAGIWRRKDLLSFLRKDEDPWVWEFVGNLRSFRSSKQFYVTSDGVRPNFSYRTAAIVRGKWNTAVVDPVFKANDIHVDYSIRGERSKEEGLQYMVEGNKADKLGNLRIFHSYVVNILKHPKSLF